MPFSGRAASISDQGGKIEVHWVVPGINKDDDARQMAIDVALFVGETHNNKTRNLRRARVVECEARRNLRLSRQAEQSGTLSDSQDLTEVVYGVQYVGGLRHQRRVRQQRLIDRPGVLVL